MVHRHLVVLGGVVGLVPGRDGRVHGRHLDVARFLCTAVSFVVALHQHLLSVRVSVSVAAVVHN